MKAPLNKHKSTDLFSRGCYGNNLPTFDSPIGATMSIKTGDELFVIRYKGPVGIQGPAIYNIHVDGLWEKWDELIANGWDKDLLYINECMRPELVVFQGELSTGNWADREWFLQGCEDSGIHMREAMKRSTFRRSGLMARLYLRERMHPSSWEDLSECINMWPDGIIELVIFNTPYGSLAHTGRNSIVWEVRNF